MTSDIYFSGQSLPRSVNIRNGMTYHFIEKHALIRDVSIY